MGVNDENLAVRMGKNRGLTTEEARRIGSKGGKKSVEVRRENKLIKDRILERMKETDWDEYIDGIIQRAKASDKGAEFLRDTVGQKPSDKVDMNTSLTMTEEDRKLYEKAIKLL